uniref:C-C motif chemokine 21 n=1 Tax=Camelus bactrianus TaxID=9837 RepID=A0A9W3F6D6_CAMBA|nr:C-C motif chemokine 21 [Camelus bactrianus]
MAQSLVLSVLVLVLAFCILQIQGSDGGAQDCCLKYSQKKIPNKIVLGYRKQEPSLGCPIPAILGEGMVGKISQPELCADPKEAWVQQLMKRLDKSPARQGSKDKRASKSDKKGKGSKGSKRTKTPKGL